MDSTSSSSGSLLSSMLQCCFSYKEGKFHDNENDILSNSTCGGVEESQPLLQDSGEDCSYGGIGDGEGFDPNNILNNLKSRDYTSHIYNPKNRRVRFASDANANHAKLNGYRTSSLTGSRTDFDNFILNGIVEETAALMIDVHNSHHAGIHISRHEANQRSRQYAELLKTLPPNLIPNLRYSTQKCMAKTPGFESGYVIKVGSEHNSRDDLNLMKHSIEELSSIMGSFQLPPEIPEFVVPFPATPTNNDED